MIGSAPAELTREAMSVIDLVDTLEDLLASSRRLPLSSNIVVNEEEVLELVDRIRLALPAEIVEARHALEDRERILSTSAEEAERTLSHAEQECERVLREATDRAAALVAQHELTEQARAHAEMMLSESETRAATVRSEADTYAREVMASLEEQLMRALTTVRRGIETLPAGPGDRRRPLRRRER